MSFRITFHKNAIDPIEGIETLYSIHMLWSIFYKNAIDPIEGIETLRCRKKKTEKTLLVYKNAIDPIEGIET